MKILFAILSLFTLNAFAAEPTCKGVKNNTPTKAEPVQLVNMGEVSPGSTFYHFEANIKDGTQNGIHFTALYDSASDTVTQLTVASDANGTMVVAQARGVKGQKHVEVESYTSASPMAPYLTLECAN